LYTFKNIEINSKKASDFETKSMLYLQAQMIDKLKEYKATLINSAVTGKIKVPQTLETKAVA